MEVGAGEVEPHIVENDMDMGESDYFSEPKFDSVVDRYYTRMYKKINAVLISTMLEMKENEGETEE